jgi:hypothetical protein
MSQSPKEHNSVQHSITIGSEHTSQSHTLTQTTDRNPNSNSQYTIPTQILTQNSQPSNTDTVLTAFLTQQLQIHNEQQSNMTSLIQAIRQQTHQNDHRDHTPNSSDALVDTNTRQVSNIPDHQSLTIFTGRHAMDEMDTTDRSLKRKTPDDISTVDDIASPANLPQPTDDMAIDCTIANAEATAQMVHDMEQNPDAYLGDSDFDEPIESSAASVVDSQPTYPSDFPGRWAVGVAASQSKQRHLHSNKIAVTALT